MYCVEGKCWVLEAGSVQGSAEGASVSGILAWAGSSPPVSDTSSSASSPHHPELQGEEHCLHEPGRRGLADPSSDPGRSLAQPEAGQ